MHHTSKTCRLLTNQVNADLCSACRKVGRWCYRGWVRCESCEVQQRHPVGSESRDDFECEHCGATLRWTDEDETPNGAKSWLWRVVE